MDNLVFSPILSINRNSWVCFLVRELSSVVIHNVNVHITVEKLLKYLRVRSLQTHHCQILALCYVYSYEGVSYWLNDGNCLDPGIWRAISSTSQINNDASSLPYVYLWGSEEIQWLANASPGGNWITFWRGRMFQSGLYKSWSSLAMISELIKRGCQIRLQDYGC